MNKEYSKEQIQQAYSIDLLEFARSEGYNCVKQGSEYRVKGYAGLIIDAEKNCFYWHSEHKGGGIIQFCNYVMGITDFKSAMRYLVGEGEVSVSHKKFIPPKDGIVSEKKDLEMPERADNVKRVYAYLINQRGIAPDVISDMVKQKLIYQDVKGNAVFVHKDKDGKTVGGDVIGTLSDKRYKGVAPGSTGVFQYNKGTDIKSIYVFEAPIDLMSFVQMHPEINNAAFISMGGLKPQYIAEYVNDSSYTVISCVDNDKAGKAFNDRILMDKMQHSTTDEINAHQTEIDGIKYQYADITHNGTKYLAFLSDEDAQKVMKSQKLEGIVVRWTNRSNFTVNTDCKQENVKDFNELLQKKKETTEQRFVGTAEQIKQAAQTFNNQLNISQSRGYAI